VVLTQFMSSLLYGVQATNVAIFVGITAIFAAIGLAAIYLPARRVTKIDPALSLRSE
jgi:ABC-type antimicrobial peptide transport system permease subunit